MNAKKLYKHIYKLLEDVTPIKADCGKLCNAACCEGDDETGMYLFPFEETMYDGTEKWLKIYDSDFGLSLSLKYNPKTTLFYDILPRE
jgi:hypothetical protein